MTEWFHFHFSVSCIGEGNGNPLQCSCLENPRDGGAWWAAVSGVAQNQTQLKWLSSSSSSLILPAQALKAFDFCNPCQILSALHCVTLGSISTSKVGPEINKPQPQASYVRYKASFLLPPVLMEPCMREALSCRGGRGKPCLPPAQPLMF